MTSAKIAAVADITIDPIVWLDEIGENTGTWHGPRTQAARDLVRALVVRAIRDYGHTCQAEEIRVYWDGTWRQVPYAG